MEQPSSAEIAKVFKLPGEKKQRELIASLVDSGNAGREILCKLWHENTSVDIRRWVVDALGGFSGKECSLIVKAALKDSSMSIRLHAIRAISKMKDAKLALAAKPLVADKSGGIRMNALDLLVELRIPGYRAAIRKCMQDEKSYIRKRAEYYQAHATS